MCVTTIFFNAMCVNHSVYQGGDTGKGKRVVWEEAKPRGDETTQCVAWSLVFQQLATSGFKEIRGVHF
jgi:hypothetical protein